MHRRRENQRYTNAAEKRETERQEALVI